MEMYAVERTTKRSTQARKDASKIPAKPNQKEVFDRVWPPQRKSRIPNKAPEPVPEPILEQQGGHSKNLI